MSNHHTKTENQPFPCGRISRRDALRFGGTVAAGSVLLPNMVAANSIASLKPSFGGPGHVVKVHMPGMRVGSYPHPDAAAAMLNKALLTFTGQKDERAAWSKIVKPGEKIGIKVNCLGTRMVSSMKEVAFAVANSLRQAGHAPENLLIFDMFRTNMMGGRYDQQPNPKKVRVLAHKEVDKYSKTFTAGPARARFSELFMELDALINLPPIKDHDLVGVTCCMKNVTFGTVEKPHINHAKCNEAICHLWAHDEVQKRVRLNIIDGSTILYDGGPKYNREALVPHESLYMTTDPVAMDALAHEMIEKLRAENGLRTLSAVRRPAHFIKMAEAMGLGIAERAHINLQEVELPPFKAPANS